MNPENQYPELKTMAGNAMFIEYAILLKGESYIKLPINRVMPKNELNDYRTLLRTEHLVDNIYFNGYMK